MQKDQRIQMSTKNKTLFLFTSWCSKRKHHILFFLLGMFLFRLIFTIYIDQDEYEGIQTAWLMMNGKHIYVDFMQHHHPFSYFLYMPFIYILGEDAFIILACRLVSWVFALGILIQLSYLIRKFSIPFWAEMLSLLSLTFCSSYYIPVLQVRPDPSMLFFALCGIQLLIRKNGSVTNSAKMLLFSGIFMGISFGFLQKSIFLIFGTGLYLLFHSPKKKVNFRVAILFSIGFSLIALPLILVLSIYTGGFENYFFWNWWINTKSLLTHSYIQMFSNTLITAGLLIVFGIIGFVSSFFKPKHSALKLIAMGLLLTFVFTIFLAKAIWIQYMLPLIVLLTIFEADVLRTFFSKQKKVLWISFIFLFFLLHKTLWVYFFPSSHQLLSTFVSYDLNRTEFLLQHTTKKDRILDGAPHLALFRYSVAPFYWWSRFPKGIVHSVKTLNHQPFDQHLIIKRTSPVIINWHPVMQFDFKNPVFEKYLYLPKMRLFIRKDFYYSQINPSLNKSPAYEKK